jgi:hypothetical protein
MDDAMPVRQVAKRKTKDDRLLVYIWTFRPVRLDPYGKMHKVKQSTSTPSTWI